jgi:hypothetical protein
MNPDVQIIRRFRAVLIVEGDRYYQCRSPQCERIGQWLHEDEFHRLANLNSRCGVLSECRRCCNRDRSVRRRLSKARDKCQMTFEHVGPLIEQKRGPRIRMRSVRAKARHNLSVFIESLKGVA